MAGEALFTPGRLFAFSSPPPLLKWCENDSFLLPCLLGVLSANQANIFTRKEYAKVCRTYKLQKQSLVQSVCVVRLRHAVVEGGAAPQAAEFHGAAVPKEFATIKNHICRKKACPYFAAAPSKSPSVLVLLNVWDILSLELMNR